jgi:PAS domain S-box-containing protein
MASVEASRARADAAGPSGLDGLGGPSEEVDAALLARLLAQTAQPVVATDLAGRVRFRNRAMEELTGVPAAEWAGLSVQDVVPEPCRPALTEALARLRETGRAQRFETNCGRRDGRAVPIEWFADLVRDEAGQPRAVFAWVTDVTERKRAERALAESERRFRELFDGAPFGYHEIDAEGILVTSTGPSARCSATAARSCWAGPATSSWRRSRARSPGTRSAPRSAASSPWSPSSGSSRVATAPG